MLSDGGGIKAVVSGYIARHNLLDKGATYIVALSGGADSVALLTLLLDLGYRVEAAHCNFHLRGAESDRDENFVAELCRRRGVALHLAHFDTHAYASLHGVSIEMAARRLRYAYFDDLRKSVGAAGVCVAHHRNDSVETVLMNLFYGGRFKCFHPHLYMSRTQIRVIRPMIYVEERSIRLETERLALPVTSSCCPFGGATKRDEAKETLARLMAETPELKSNIIHALKNMRESEGWPVGMLNG